MNQEQIIQWAKEVNAYRYTNRLFPDQPAFAFDIERLTRFTNLVAQHQKEQDAQVANNYSHRNDDMGAIIAAAIRGNKV